jgi:hypothetical protein
MLIQPAIRNVGIGQPGAVTEDNLAVPPPALTAQVVEHGYHPSQLSLCIVSPKPVDIMTYDQAVIASGTRGIEGQESDLTDSTN